MPPPLLLLRDIAIRFGNTQLLERADLSVAAGERICLVGRNGSGKSTLMKIAAGLVEPDDGSRFVQPGSILRYLPQEPNLAGHAMVRAYVEAGLGEGYDSDRTFYLLGHLGLTGEEDPRHLSGGETRRAVLARALAPMPDILLLDEPTNHLDLPTIEWLEAELNALTAAIVMVSHDRRFLENMSRACLWLDRGRTRSLDRGFSHFEAWRDEVLEQEEIERHKLDRQIAREEDWIRYGVSGRRKRNVRRVAELEALRRNRREELRVAGTVKLQASEAGEGGTCVIEARKASKNFGERTVVHEVSLRVHKGNRIGIAGANGSGKTTLLNLLIGRLTPDSGTVKVGTGVELALLDQARETLHEETTVQAVLTGGGSDTVFVGGEPRHVVSYLKDFLFSAAQARQPVRVLSGGERARLLLAKILAKPSNLLVLDEPTNDLDLETLDLLEEMLASYPGTIIAVSHDRDFLDRVATSVLMAEGDGRFTEYAGGYSDMVAQRGEGVVARDVAAARNAKPAEEKVGKEKRSREKSKAKLTFNDTHALKTLPARIAELEKTIATLTERLSAADFYARDPKGFSKASAELEVARSELAESEERWLELEIKREEIER
jgi:ATP-binding cassette subfamily F protein uup